MRSTLISLTALVAFASSAIASTESSRFAQVVKRADAGPSDVAILNYVSLPGAFIDASEASANVSQHRPVA